jgi:hypothetical protein
LMANSKVVDSSTGKSAALAPRKILIVRFRLMVRGCKQMAAAENLLDETEVKSFLFGLAFVREFSITVVSLVPGSVTIELPFNERFSGPPSLFPASMVGTAGDVAAVASCLSLMPKG